jgi:hypothetical protein
VKTTDEEVERPFRFVMDISRTTEKLGYKPRLLEEGLRIYLEETVREGSE